MPGAERTVAMLCYYFPPVGGGGTPRSLKLVKYLPQHGYRPVVVTVGDASVMGQREFREDASGMDELDASTFDLLRIKDPEPRRLRRWLEKRKLFPILWALAYPLFWEQQRFWSQAAARRLVEEYHQGKRIDLIYASAGPYSSLVAAEWAARRLGVPWVADLRDLWTRDTLRFFPSALHYWWESRLERRVLRRASAIIANTPLSAQRLRQWLGEPAAGRVTVIPNGFDPAEMTAPGSRSRRPGDPITIVHAGTLCEPGLRRSRLGCWRPHDLDDEARSPIPVAKALKLLVDRRPDLARRLRFRLIGFTPESSRRAVQSLGLGDLVRVEGLVPRDQAIAAMHQADALLIVQLAFADADRPMPYIPGKAYECLATGLPILAPVGPGDLRDLLKSAPQAYLCNPRDPEDIAGAIERMLRDIDQGSVAKPAAAWLEQFTGDGQARRMAGVFDSLPSVSATNERPFVAYCVQKYPALRTTFIRREVEALRKLGLRIEVFSMRPADRDGLRDEPEAIEHLQTTHYLPANPISLGSIWANVMWALRRPVVTMRNLRLALGDPGQRGWHHRVRLALQVWRGAVMVQMLRRMGPCQHIHAHFADGAATTALAAARLLDAGFSFTSHTSYAPPVLRVKLREAKFVASISEFDRQNLIRIGGTSIADRVHVVRCGIPLEQWPFEPRSGVHDPLRVLSIGALTEKKGHDVLIRACRLLMDRGTQVCCRIVGAGPLQDRLQSMIDELGLGGAVELLGPLPQARAREQLKWADVFVLACKQASSGDTDGLPVSLMEAMAAGVPVVSCAIAGVPELIEDGHSGFLAGPGDVLSLAEKLRECAAAGRNNHATCAQARKQVELHFGSADQAARQAELLLTALGSSSAASQSRKGAGGVLWRS